VRNGRLAETDSDVAEFNHVSVRQIRVTLTKVLDGLVHPRTLVAVACLQNTATIDMAE
jgi:hypothetical protein